VKTFRKHLNKKLENKEFKQLYDKEREMLENKLVVKKNSSSFDFDEIKKSGRAPFSAARIGTN
jgi:hypothetical protein